MTDLKPKPRQFACTCMQMHRCLCVCKYASVCNSKFACMWMQMFACMCVCMRVRTHAYSFVCSVYAKMSCVCACMFIIPLHFSDRKFMLHYLSGCLPSVYPMVVELCGLGVLEPLV